MNLKSYRIYDGEQGIIQQQTRGNMQKMVIDIN